MKYLLLLGLLLLVGCANFSTHQLARTVPVKSNRIHVGASLLKSDLLSSAVALPDNNNPVDFSQTIFELGARFGVFRYADIGVRATIPGAIGADFKYQLIDTDFFAFSVGVMAGYTRFSDLNTLASTLSLSFVDGAIPLYLQLDFSQMFGIYFSAKYISRFLMGSSNSNIAFYTTSGGVRIGNTVGVLLEVTYVREIKGQFNGLQYGGVIFFGSAPSAHFDVGRSGHEVRWKRGRSDEYFEGKEKQRASRVLKVSPNQGKVLISHESLRVWKKNEVACIVDNEGLTVGCGMVKAVNSEKAMLEITDRREAIFEGMKVLVPHQ